MGGEDAVGVTVGVGVGLEVVVGVDEVPLVRSGQVTSCGWQPCLMFPLPRHWPVPTLPPIEHACWLEGSGA